MARGDVKVGVYDVTSNSTAILNRAEYEAVPMTVDFSNVSDTADNGELVVKAGTPVDADGVPVTATPWTGAVGIVLDDVVESYPTVAVVKKGYIHVTRAQAASGLTYDGDLITAIANAGGRIVLEEPIVIASSSSSGGSTGGQNP